MFRKGILIISILLTKWTFILSIELWWNRKWLRWGEEWNEKTSFGESSKEWRGKKGIKWVREICDGKKFKIRESC